MWLWFYYKIDNTDKSPNSRITPNIGEQNSPLKFSFKMTKFVYYNKICLLIIPLLCAYCLLWQKCISIYLCWIHSYERHRHPKQINAYQNTLESVQNFIRLLMGFHFQCGRKHSLYWHAVEWQRSRPSNRWNHLFLICIYLYMVSPICDAKRCHQKVLNWVVELTLTYFTSKNLADFKHKNIK